MMLGKENLPNISTLFDPQKGNANHFLYQEIIRNVLKQILPQNLIHPSIDDPELIDDQRKEFLSLLPLFHVTPFAYHPTNISFYTLAKFRPNAVNFFCEMISHWLVPGKRLNIVMYHAVNFRMPDFGDDIYTLCEVMVRVDNTAELEELRHNLPILETEVRLGVQSAYYARRILEIKGLSADAKTAAIQEYIATLIARLPKDFDHDLLTETQHVLVMCSDEFKAARACRHLSRIICAQYLFRKGLRRTMQEAPDKRHLSLKLFRSTLHLPEGDKAVLGVSVGINFIRDKEIFEERHLMSAIQNYIPSAQAIENSFFANRRGAEPISTFYLEIYKNGGERFTADEIRILRRELPADLKDRIEHLMHPIFMPRNEEEIMRNVLSLSNQIKYLHDLPQVIISFDQQSHADLFFTVILVRVLKPGSPSIHEMFQNSETPLNYVHDRTKTVGYLRKKYAKEAAVFGVNLPKDQFLRRDHSIDLNKARQTVVSELVKVVGEVRDFNGGMISKQNELLCALREQLNKSVKYNDLLLENFFYSLMPDIMRTLLEPHILKEMFELLLESIEDGFFRGENYAVKTRCQSTYMLAMIKTEDRTLKDTLSRGLHRFEKEGPHLASCFVSVYEVSYLGYLYLCDEHTQQQVFNTALQHSLVAK